MQLLGRIDGSVRVLARLRAADANEPVAIQVDARRKVGSERAGAPNSPIRSSNAVDTGIGAREVSAGRPCRA